MIVEGSGEINGAMRPVLPNLRSFHLPVLVVVAS
jgi:hypothetical protein